jgi:hypothetical protein
MSAATPFHFSTSVRRDIARLAGPSALDPTSSLEELIQQELTPPRARLDRSAVDGRKAMRRLMPNLHRALRAIDRDGPAIRNAPEQYGTLKTYSI